MIVKPASNLAYIRYKHRHIFRRFGAKLVKTVSPTGYGGSLLTTPAYAPIHEPGDTHAYVQSIVPRESSSDPYRAWHPALMYGVISLFQQTVSDPKPNKTKHENAETKPNQTKPNMETLKPNQSRSSTRSAEPSNPGSSPSPT